MAGAAGCNNVHEYIPVDPVFRLTIRKLPAKHAQVLVVLQALRDGSPERYPDLLRRARDEIYSELERVSLRPFTSSEPFVQLLNALSQGNDLTQLRKELSEFEA